MFKKLLCVSLFFSSVTAIAAPYEFEVHSGQVCRSGQNRVRHLSQVIAAFPDKVIVYTEVERVGSEVRIISQAIVKKPVRLEDVVGTSDMVCVRVVGR